MKHASSFFRMLALAAAVTTPGYVPESLAAAGSGDGTMTVSPVTNNAPGSTTNIFKFSFRADSVGSWLAGAQVRLTVPAEWTPPQTSAPASPGYVKATLFNGSAVSIADVTGTGPWAVTVNYQGANGTTKGFDLAYTNVTSPVAEGAYEFTAASRQAGSDFTNLVASPVITVLTRQNQSITFPAIPYVLTPNGLTLTGTASSGLPVTYTVASGPASLSGGSNLTFSATGTVKIVAAQAGNIAWYPAVSLTNTFPVYAGGTMTLSPTLAMADCATNVLKFKFRGDGIGPGRPVPRSGSRYRKPGRSPRPIRLQAPVM